jgi:predicted GIY-YIG superfamily endonuclease
MRYVYILESLTFPGHFYVGLTSDLKARLKRHNERQVTHTAKYAPWRVNTYLGFDDDVRAVAFERYLKSGSGRAFARKRL